MSLNARMRSAARKTQPLLERTCRCRANVIGPAILVTDGQGHERLFHTLREFYDNTVWDTPIYFPPTPADPTLCDHCGRPIAHVRALVAEDHSCPRDLNR